MARDDLHFRLRIPEELKAKVDAAAKAAGRSMTAEIIARLEQSFEHDIPGLNERLDEMAGMMSEMNFAYEQRFERLESKMYSALERIGMYDPNAD